MRTKVELDKIMSSKLLAWSTGDSPNRTFKSYRL